MRLPPWRRPLLLAAALSLGTTSASSQTAVARPAAFETGLLPAPRAPRSVAWVETLPAVALVGANGARERVRLYGPDGEVDPEARARFEHVVAGDAPPHALAPRLEQLVVKAAYHFGGARVVVVSGFREHAGRHGTGEAIDFKLEGVRAATLAAWLRHLPRVGVGIYTHPRTQYVHLDVRDTSYHWIDASPPGVRWRERPLRDPGQVKRDAGWRPEDDLPG